VTETDPRHRYHRAVILTVPAGRTRAAALVRELREHIADVELREVPLDDPSDYRALWRHVPGALHGMPGTGADEVTAPGTTDVLLSAGTPQAQTVWVLLVQSGLLRARMLQVIPAAFVPHPHPRAIRPVSLDVDGFPAIRVLREEVERLRAAVRIHDPRVVASSDAMRALLARAREGRSERAAGPHRGRDRHRQGAARPRHPRWQRPRGGDHS
jgi:two-component system response regulator AtoC